jgi:hypothetical protein
MFQPITIKWGGDEYTIPANGVLKAIAIIEEHFTLADMVQQIRTNTVKMATLACAWGNLLRHLGAKVTDEEVYAGLFEGDSEEITQRIVTTVNMLMVIMVPAKKKTTIATETDAMTNPDTAPRQRRSSNRSTRR